MQWFHGIAAVLFAISAVLQWNDPDPIAWILLYVAAAILAGLAARGRAPAMALVALIVIAAGWMLLLADSLLGFIARGDPGLLVATMKASDPLIEESREFLGLMLVVIWAVIAMVGGRRRVADGNRLTAADGRR